MKYNIDLKTMMGATDPDGDAVHILQVRKTEAGANLNTTYHAPTNKWNYVIDTPEGAWHFDQATGIGTFDDKGLPAQMTIGTAVTSTIWIGLGDRRADDGSADSAVDIWRSVAITIDGTAPVQSPPEANNVSVNITDLTPV